MSEQNVYDRLVQDIKAAHETEMSYRSLVVATPALGEFLDPIIDRLMHDAIAMQDAANGIKIAFPNVK